MTQTRDQRELDLLGHATVNRYSPKEATHTEGRGEPLHDWFPYLEGFSSTFVKNLLDDYFEKPTSILEPFSGVGTTPVTLSQLGVECGYSEVNPALRELIALKAFTLSLPKNQKSDLASKLHEIRISFEDATACSPPSIDLVNGFKATFGNVEYFTRECFEFVCRLKTFEQSINDKHITAFFRMAVATSLLKGSLLRRAGDVRYKTKRELEKGIPSISELISEKLMLMSKDVSILSELDQFGQLKSICENAKDLHSYSGELFDGVITSPPYLNGTNYIRNTKLELWYLEYLRTKQDMRFYRSAVVTSAINDVSKESGRLVIDEAAEIVAAIQAQCYDQRIPKMVSAYFDHMHKVFIGLARAVKNGAPVCVDIGDSVYSEVHVPTHDVLAAIGQRVGLKLEHEVLLRKRFSNKGAPLSQRLLVFRK